MADRICCIDDCQARVLRRGLCATHYAQWEPNDWGLTPHERFWEKVDVGHPLGCWVWVGRRAANGYGRFWVTGGDVQAHRFAWEAMRTPIPPGLTIDHLCRNKLCVNPDHLRVVDQRTNILASEGLTARNARKTHCKRGHPFAGENLRVKPNGERVCRQCVRYRQGSAPSTPQGALL